MNLTLQHDRGLPIAIMTVSDSDDAMRFRAEIAAGARGDQALSDVRAGLLRGASVEMKARQAARG